MGLKSKLLHFNTANPSQTTLDEASASLFGSDTRNLVANTRIGAIGDALSQQAGDAAKSAPRIALSPKPKQSKILLRAVHSVFGRTGAVQTQGQRESDGQIMAVQASQNKTPTRIATAALKEPNSTKLTRELPVFSTGSILNNGNRYGDRRSQAQYPHHDGKGAVGNRASNPVYTPYPNRKYVVGHKVLSHYPHYDNRWAAKNPNY